MCKVIGQSLFLYAFKEQFYLGFYSFVTYYTAIKSRMEFFFVFVKMGMHNISFSYQISDDTQALIGIENVNTFPKIFPTFILRIMLLH